MIYVDGKSTWQCSIAWCNQSEVQSLKLLSPLAVITFCITWSTNAFKSAHTRVRSCSSDIQQLLMTHEVTYKWWVSKHGRGNRWGNNEADVNSTIKISALCNKHLKIAYPHNMTNFICGSLRIDGFTLLYLWLRMINPSASTAPRSLEATSYANTRHRSCLKALRW